MNSTPVTRFLIVFNVVIFGVQLLVQDGLLTRYALWPLGDAWSPDIGAFVSFRPWQLVSYAFLHGGYLHIALNMFGLYMFGREVEQALGSRQYAKMYVLAVLTAGVMQLLVVSMDATATPHPTVGASGGVFGVLLAFAMLFPNRLIVPLFPPIPVRAWLFVTIYGAIELLSGIFGSSAGIAHFAHLGGMLGAFVIMRDWRRRAARRL